MGERENKIAKCHGNENKIKTSSFQFEEKSTEKCAPFSSTKTLCIIAEHPSANLLLRTMHGCHLKCRHVGVDASGEQKRALLLLRTWFMLLIEYIAKLERNSIRDFN